MVFQAIFLCVAFHLGVTSLSKVWHTKPPCPCRAELACYTLMAHDASDLIDIWTWNSWWSQEKPWFWELCLLLLLNADRSQIWEVTCSYPGVLDSESPNNIVELVKKKWLNPQRWVVFLTGIFSPLLFTGERSHHLYEKCFKLSVQHQWSLVLVWRRVGNIPRQHTLSLEEGSEEMGTGVYKAHVMSYLEW